MRPALVLSVALAVALPFAGVIAGNRVAVVSQTSRAFSVSAVRIDRNDVVRFTNDDKFLHQIFVAGASFSFESAEQEPGTSVDINFSKTGSFEVRCRIHPKMHLAVDVN